MTKNKVMLCTDASEKTGFGGVSHKIATALASDNFDVSFVGWGFKYESAIPRANYMLYPTANDPFGSDCLPYYIQTIKPEVLITQADTRMIQWLPQAMSQIPNKPTWVFYVVIDGSVWDYEGKNKKWPSNWMQVIKASDKVVAMTKFGQSILKDNGVESEVIYHGVDTARFVPVSPENKIQIKKNVGLKDAPFIFGGVFKNISRKCSEKYLQSFKIFLEMLPDGEKEKCALLLHTNPQPQNGGEFDIPQQAFDYGLQPGKNVIFSPAGIPTEMMPLVYQAMDVFMHLGTMEGFGLPIIEAMSCGLPSIGVNSCTMPELFGDSALLSDVPRYDAKGCHKISFGSYNGVECDIVDPWDVAQKMLKLYRDESLRKELGMKATERAIKEFDWYIIQKKWVDYVKKLVITEDQVPDEWKKLLAETA